VRRRSRGRRRSVGRGVRRLGQRAAKQMSSWGSTLSARCASPDRGRCSRGHHRHAGLLEELGRVAGLRRYRFGGGRLLTLGRISTVGMRRSLGCADPDTTASGVRPFRSSGRSGVGRRPCRARSSNANSRRPRLAIALPATGTNSAAAGVAALYTSRRMRWRPKLPSSPG
jgi:hypothetical protein